ILHSQHENVISSPARDATKKGSSWLPLKLMGATLLVALPALCGGELRHKPLLEYSRHRDAVRAFYRNRLVPTYTPTGSGGWKCGLSRSGNPLVPSCLLLCSLELISSLAGNSHGVV